MESELFRWLSCMPWFGWLALTAIICGSMSSIMNAHYQHVERMEMIRQGMNPDFQDEKPKVPREV